MHDFTSGEQCAECSEAGVVVLYFFFESRFFVFGVVLAGEVADHGLALLINNPGFLGLISRRIELAAQEFDDARRRGSHAPKLCA